VNWGFLPSRGTLFVFRADFNQFSEVWGMILCLSWCLRQFCWCGFLILICLGVIGFCVVYAIYKMHFLLHFGTHGKDKKCPLKNHNKNSCISLHFQQQQFANFIKLKICKKLTKFTKNLPSYHILYNNQIKQKAAPNSNFLLFFFQTKSNKKAQRYTFFSFQVITPKSNP
jgi:hypothetical protein